ncbi:nucleoside deaminase [Billgrantia sulfidoxydans]|uniref:nucleoside deaminase n=1 Tax=Billgrantia sulfidoxydans TaxID=2733484 RepID=UPI001F5FC1BB|nr:nucleoside deaminase [Halomonas sulfidoxydans]
MLAEGHNQVASGDRTRHPEFELARWAAANMSPAARAAATVYTSGEHCPMCAAAHGWVGLGRIVYASSSEQLSGWLAELGAPAAPCVPCRFRKSRRALSWKGRRLGWQSGSVSCTTASMAAIAPDALVVEVEPSSTTRGANVDPPASNRARG